MCKIRQIEKIGSCQQCSNPELFPARVQVLGCMAPFCHQVDSMEVLVVLTFYRSSAWTRRSLPSKAGDESEL